MNNKLKSGLLLFMIVGPLLLFGLFHLLGTNHYGIQTYYPTGVDNNGDTTYHKIPDFSFINQNGEEVTLANFEDKIFVVDFFFTTCPTICPKMSSNIAYLQKSFKNHGDEVKFLSHTVDPIHDSVEVLKEYSKVYEAKDDVWHMVTGDKQKLYNQAKEGYKIIADDGDGFSHSEKLILVDKNKNIRGYYDGTNEEEVENLLSEIMILMYEQSN